VLKIAEVTSRFTSVDEFVKLVNALGFSLSHKVRPSLSLSSHPLETVLCSS